MALLLNRSKRHFCFPDTFLMIGVINMTQQTQFTKAVGNASEINELLRRYGVKFGIYKNGVFNEQFFPFDPIPRVISAEDFQSIEKGLVQRVNALNEFLFDIYHEKKIVRDGIIPEDFIYISKGYLALRIPSGASYPLIARDLTRIAAPQAFEENPIIDNRGYAELLKETMEHVNCGGARAILTPGRYNAAYFEHSYLAEHTGSVLVQNDELFVEDNILYHRTYSGGKTRIGVLYRRIADEYLDPLTFLPESLIGIPNLMEAYRSGNVGIINAPGNGVADDKGIYYFVPKMIKYYLGEEPILKNAPTYLPFYEEDMKYVMEHLDTLVIKDVAEAGGYGVVFGSDLTKEKLEEFRKTIIAEPRRFIAQEVIDFLDLPILENGETVMRKADLRAFVLSGETTKVWASGLTRFSRNPDSFVVNSSQGGGFKDTWVLSR